MRLSTAIDIGKLEYEKAVAEHAVDLIFNNVSNQI
jgi:hypothetical protein